MIVFLLALLVLYRKQARHPWLIALAAEFAFHLAGMTAVAIYLALTGGY